MTISVLNSRGFLNPGLKRKPAKMEYTQSTDGHFGQHEEE